MKLLSPEKLAVLTLGVDLPSIEETQVIARELLELRDKVRKLELALEDKQKLIDGDLKKGLDQLKAYILSGVR